MLKLFKEFNELILFKARQLGWSWLVAGYTEHKIQFSDSAKGLFISQGEKEAWDMVAKAKFVANNLPDFLKLTQMHPDNKAILDFQVHDSKIEALPSTEKAGRSTDATVVVRDELAQHPYGDKNFAAIGPTIDSGGQLIDISTIDKLNLENHFTDRVNKAIRGARRTDLKSGLVVYTGGESGATLVFGGWRLRPVRQEGMTLDDWFEKRIKPKYTPLEIEQEYPENIEDALKISEVKGYFSARAIEEMMHDLDQPFYSGDINTHNGIVRVYKQPIVGRKYIMYTDPSDGVEDPFVTVVMDSITKEGVCIATGMIHADECARIHDELVRTYNNAYNGFEVNGHSGGVFQSAIKLLETPKVAPRRTPDGKRQDDKFGWYITPHHKKLYYEWLENAIARHLIISHDREFVNQLQGTLRPEKEGQAPRTAKGMHDDFVSAWAGVWAVSQYVPKVLGSPQSGKYKE